MKWKNSEWFLCFFLLICGLQIIIGARQNPLKDPKICGRPECDFDASNSKFVYNPTTKYVYDYSLHVQTEFFGSGQNTSDLYLKSKIHLIFPKKCEGILIIKDVKLKEEDSENEIVQTYYDYDYAEQEEESDVNNDELAKALESHELRFSFHDGRIGELCPSVEESTWVLNFKKGILSSFQNTMLRFDVDFNTTEIDVSGTCDVAYTLQGAESTQVIINKFKDVSSCRFHNKMHSVLHTSPYSFRDDKSIWPILDSESFCDVTVDHNVYNSVHCTERHQLVPFSNNKSGAVTTSDIKIKLNNEETYEYSSYASLRDDITLRSSLHFDHTPIVKPTHGEIRGARDLLKEMCTLGFPNIQREFIDIFTKFLETVRLLSYKALHQLLSRSSSICAKGKNHMLESLPYIGTTESYQLMRDQIINEEVSKEIAEDWMSSMAFIKRPDEETLETFYTILVYGQKKINPEFTLGSTAVVHSFCRNNPNCGENEKVLRIVQHLEQEFLKIFQANLNERRSKERLSVVLKGLGNIGIMTEEFSNKLKKVIVDEVNLSVETRLEAVLAYRRSDCVRHKDFFLSVYENFTINSEIRIYSYLQAMRCPDYLSISSVKQVLENEEVNQVGSYVWSHLTNLAKSASPVRIEAQGLLINDDLGTKYKMDIRKFSRNYEHTLFFDEYNFGTDVEANLIFGTDSYLPRILTMNFTADLFGESCNLFEISARTQGFEQIVSSIFGPKGPLNADVVKQKFGYLNKFFGDDSGEMGDVEDLINLEKLRLKRTAEDYNFEEDVSPSSEESSGENDADEKDEKIRKDINKLGYHLNYNYNEPRAVIGLRVFGNDLRYTSINGFNEVVAAGKKLDPISLARRILSGKEITYSKSGVFLDTSFNIPLSSGLPLSIHAYGASSIDVRLSGNLKQRDSTEGISLDVDGKIKPSVSVDVLTTMESDFFYAKSGIRVKSNLYSSSSVEGNLKVRGSKLVSLTLGLPQQKNEIFSAKSELLVFKKNEEISQPGIEKRSSNTTCTWSVIDTAIGLRVCSHHSLPDVSDSSLNYPGLILSGPIDVNVQLEKVDPTIKTFVLEYKWNTIDNVTQGSFTFETPGSAVKRILKSKIISKTEGVNASISLLLGDSSHSAVAMYKSEPDDKILEIYMENNGEKNFALDMKMNRTSIRNGWLFYPGFTLYIKNEIVAGMRGTFKITSKNNVLQNDINLNFETKKLQAKIYGNFQKTEVTSSVKLAMDYRFEENKIERIEFDGKLSNKGQKTRAEYDGQIKLKTTAYPNLNFASTMTWLSVLAHTEAKITYNNAVDFIDPKFTTTGRLVFARIEPESPYDPYRARALIEFTRPKSNVDFRIQLKHEEIHKRGVLHNFLVGLRYAPQKEATGFFSIYLPNRKYFHVDANLNITVPEFDSCTARLKLIEQTLNYYTIDFNGNWFTNQSITLNGFYANRGSRNYPSYHQIKMHATSPSFENTTVDFLYRRNALEIFTDLQATYKEIPYGLMLKISSLGLRQKNSYLELKLNQKLYWLSSKLFTRENKLLTVEIHLDKVRDIHINIRGIKTAQKKELSVEVKWDANQDPSQRLAILAELNNPNKFKYDGIMMLTYPDRTFSCGFDVFIGGPTYKGNGRISWNTNEALTFKYNAGFMPNDTYTDAWFDSELQTPFEGWRQNKFNGGVFLIENLVLFNSTLLWAENQFFGIKYESNYLISDEKLNCELLLGVNSSIPDVPTVTIHFEHNHDDRNINTDAIFTYTDANLTITKYTVQSDWKFDKTNGFKNITGGVQIRTPFENYFKNNLALSLSLKENRQIQAAGKMNFDNRKFTLYLDGYVKKFTDNMLQVNITTPYPKFQLITGRFGLNERKRHAVAEVSAPVGAIGGEILLAINSLNDFDVKLSLASPVEGFKRIALVAKQQTDVTDWRGTWNNVTLGFTGVWRIKDYADFEYSYMVYTPLKNFEENGVVIKFLNSTDEFTYMAYGKLSTFKLGFKINGKPRPFIANQLGSNQLDVQLLDDSEYQLPVEKYEEDDDADLFSLIASFELDTLIYPTIDGMVDIQESGEYFFTTGNIQLPEGQIDFSDNVYFPDWFNIENILVIKTPFNFAKDIKAKFEYNIKLSKMYSTALQIAYLGKDWTTLGYLVNYTTANETDYKAHDIRLSLKTPFLLMPRIDVTGLLESKDSGYKTNVTAKTLDTSLSFGGSLETNANFFDAIFGLSLKTKVVPFYGCQVQMKREVSDLGNSILFGFEIQDNTTEKRIRMETSWSKSESHLNGKCKFITNFLPLKLSETSIIMVKSPNPSMSFDMLLENRANQRTEFKAVASRKKDVVNIEILTPMADFKNITLTGLLMKTNNPNEHRLSGQLSRNNKVFYNVDGQVTLISDFPVKVYLITKPKINGPSGVIEFSISNIADNYGKTFRFNSIEDGKMCQINGGYSFISPINWELSVLVQSTEPEISRINLNAKLKPTAQGQYENNFNLETPWKHLGIENVHLTSNMIFQKTFGKINGEYEIENFRGKANTEWTWIFLEDMKLSIQNTIEKPNSVSRVMQTSVQYINPERNFQRFSCGGKLNVDNKWSIGVKSDVKFLSHNDVYASLDTLLPAPIGDTHHLNIIYRGNLFESALEKFIIPVDVFVEAKYSSDEAKRRLSTRGSYRNVQDVQGIAHIEWGKDSVPNDVIEGNFQMLPKGEARKEFFVKLITPLFKDEDTLFANGNYDYKNEYHSVLCVVSSPSSYQLLNTDINFSTMNNLNGNVNATIPFFNVSWLRGDFDFNTKGGDSLRFIKLTWPTNSAYFKMENKFTSKNLDRDLQGTIKMEVPLATAHRADIEYGLKERSLLNTGHANVHYNGDDVLNGKYSCKTEERVGFEKNVVDISLENKLKPIGIHYIHSKQYTDFEFPDYDMKHVELFELRNTKEYNITGEFHIRSTQTGQEYKVVAIHPNRTVILNSEYDYQGSKTTQTSKLQLSPTAWIGYNLYVVNNTSPTNESQNFLIEVSYPQRKLSATGWYYITDDIFDSDIAFKWNDDKKRNKNVRTGLLWKNEPLTNEVYEHQSAILSIGHSSFAKDITFKGLFYRSLKDLLKAELKIDYCTEPDHLVDVHFYARDQSQESGYYNYVSNILAEHNASDLHVKVDGYTRVRPNIYETRTTALYKRGYFQEKNGLLFGKLDLFKKEIEYEREIPDKTIRLWILPKNAYPVYGFNASFWDTPELNSTGYFFIDLNEKYTRLDFNLTPDATQNIQMIGHIPDARNAFLDMWRNYEEIRVIDVSSYIRMNHSRLLTGQFHWRPKMKIEIKEKLKEIGASFYESISSGIDFWIKSLYEETMESVNDVWYNAKDKTSGLFDDIKELQVLENDLKDFRKFINASYEANDFYIKTGFNFTMTILDELAIRDRIESLPKILTELWQAMGDSGKALRKSILWLFETIRASYLNGLEAINKFFHGQSLEHLSKLMQKGVERYDKFVKDLHISFIKYVENLWTKVSYMLSNYWKLLLKKIEPHIFRFIHYIESAAWNMSKEVFDFIYKRTNEIAESPYFNQVSSFTQDIDRLYRDIAANDAITNLKKYSAIAWEFLKEKYFKLVPFGKELNDVFTELWDEIKSLQKLPHIQMILNKLNEIKLKIEWIADELQIENRIHQIWRLLRKKIGSYTMTALQTDEMYREAKTLFVFDPDTGIIDFEQKLPMSWHAFNETPKFEEIPEYKMIADVQNFFGGSNFSIVGSMYTIRSHLDPKTWLPPYSAHSLLIGSNHFMTFDSKFVGFSVKSNSINKQSVLLDQCSYLLAHDFFQNNFTLLSEPSMIERNGVKMNTRKLTLLTNENHIEIDITGNSIRIDNSKSPTLPVQAADLIIYRDTDMIVIQSSKGFTLNCNLQFDYCWFELGSWYFGQTAGLLGTMNNEPFDDMLTSTNAIAKDEPEFLNSWNLNSCKPSTRRYDEIENRELEELCHEFFETTYFGSCFEYLDPKPFHDMCLSMGTNSISTVLMDNHPAQKGACTAAIAYIEACDKLRVPLRVPEKCVHCNLMNGSYVGEGTFVEIDGAEIPQTTDVVFIVEAKPCNHNLRVSKSMMTLVTTLNTELEANGLRNNRYAVVTFGGRAPFDKARTVVHNNKIFSSDISKLRFYFDHIETHDGMNNDVFGAISTASKSLIFRPGASKTFILLPCSDCNPKDMRFDYSAVLQIMVDEGITMHILMDKEFTFNKPKIDKVFFGMDRDLAYSKRDIKDFKGDTELRKQIRMPKEGLLGSCSPLAIESNGSVFSAPKLRPIKNNPVRKFSSVFAKRVAKTAKPNNCQICECNGHNTGIAYMICTTCNGTLIEDGLEDFDPGDVNFDWDDDDDDIIDELDEAEA